ncbi:MAG TPA: flagellar export protein FliJ [Solirubrobacteraceae bacterium]|nr:flagellar export protein FliJ [Solirubrobacteraceae bacterium]
MSTGSSFRFRLERVRALRERREDIARQELAKARSRLTGSQSRLDAVDAHLAQVLADQRVATSTANTVDAAELRARQAFVERIEAQRVSDVRELRRHEADVAERDNELGDAAREHRMLERLKERQHAEHDREAGRREGIALDEIAIDRFRRSAA